MNLQMTPDKDHEPFECVPGYLNKEQVTTIDQLAEEDYKRRFGQRRVEIHLIKKDSESSGDEFYIRETLLPYIKRYPTNRSIFYIVNLVDKTAEPLGWLTHKEIEEGMVTYLKFNSVSRIDGRFLHDMKEFTP